jgi:hypothetical protein
VDELLKAHKMSKEPASEFNEFMLSSIGSLLSTRGPRFHAVVTSLERKNFQDLRTASGRPVEFVDIPFLSREDSLTLVRNKVELQKVEWPKDTVERQYIDFAIGASLGHPRTLEYIAYMISGKGLAGGQKKLTAGDVLQVLGKHFETQNVLDPCTYDQLADLLKMAVRAASLGASPIVSSGKVRVSEKFEVPYDDLIKYGLIMDPVQSLNDSTLTRFSPGFFIECMKKLGHSSKEEHRDLADALGQIFDPKVVEKQAIDRGFIFEGFHLGFLALQAWALGDGTKSLGDVFQHVPRLMRNHKEELEKVQFINKTPVKIREASSKEGFVEIGMNTFRNSGTNLVLHHQPMETGADISIWSKQPSGKVLVVAHECKFRVDDGTSGPSELQLQAKVQAMYEHISGTDNMDFVHVFAVRNRMTPKTHDIIATVGSNHTAGEGSPHESSSISTFSLDEDDLTGLYRNMNMSPILALKKDNSSQK